MEITKTYTKTFNLKDTNDAKALARDYAANAAEVWTEPRTDTVDGRKKVVGMDLYVNDEIVGSVDIDRQLSEIEYLEAFALLVEKMKAAPVGAAVQTSGGLGFKRGKLSEAEKLEIADLYSNGMSISDIVSTTSRSEAAVTKVLQMTVTV